MKQKKYLEIYKSIKKQIAEGDFKSGEKLPSKRVMAEKWGCSTITVENAYGMLFDEGYILPKERSGYFVREINPLFPNKTEEKIKFDYLEEPSGSAPEFEYSLWFKTIRKVISEKGSQLFIKSPSMGCAVIRNTLSDYLRRYRGMIASPHQIVIGSGAEQLYEIAVKILGRDKIYGIETPSYSQIEAVYKLAGAKIFKLPLEQDGIRLESLKQSKIDVLHVTPFRSFPTDITTSIEKKFEYIKWTNGEKFVIEDDFNSEFFMPGKPIETLYSLDKTGHVIYINTFSKSLSPSMRMGYMILPEKLIDLYNEKLGSFSCSVPVLDQYVLAEYISSGNFERHLNRVRRKNKGAF